jgi:2-hydroxycyclohexanecarboxyl-CoA dehydrogenase
MRRFDDRLAFVTGGASGIGAATAVRLASEGARVVVTDRDGEGARVVAKEIDGLAFTLDVTDDEAVREVVAAVGPIDVLVNNAGAGRLAMFRDTDASVWDRELAVNLRGAMSCTHAVLDGMCARRRGAIVNVASEAGVVGTVGGASYSAAKAAVIGFTKAIAREAAPFGVRSNSVAPGPIDTPLLNGAASDGGALGAAVRQGMIDATVLGRVGRPEEVAAAIAFLASDDASYVTGHTLSVSGGVSMS